MLKWKWIRSDDYEERGETDSKSWLILTIFKLNWAYDASYIFIYFVFEINLKYINIKNTDSKVLIQVA